MDSRYKLIERLPPFLQDKIEYIKICDTTEPNISDIWIKIDEIYKNLFLYELNIYGVKRWEKILKITPKASESLEDRRFRIINKFLNKVPFTIRSLENILDTLLGKNNYKMDYCNDTFTLTIRVRTLVEHRLEELRKTLREIVPTNIVIEDKILFNKHIEISNYTHEELEIFTHKNLREDELLTGSLFNNHLEFIRFKHKELESYTHSNLRKDKLNNAKH